MLRPRIAALGLGILAGLADISEAFSGGRMLRAAPSMVAQGGFARGRQIWEDQYKGFIAHSGFQVCGAAFEAYRQLGRGAMYVSKDTETPASAYGNLQYGAESSVFIPVGRLSITAVRNQDTTDINEIFRRVASYDPDQEIVVIFEVNNVCGVDVLRPRMSPQEMAKALRFQEDVADFLLEA